MEGGIWDEIAAEAGAESALWREALLPAAERTLEPVFSPLGPRSFEMAVETIYEGYLAHYGRPRLFACADSDLALLLGDRLYARGLVQASAQGSSDVVADLASLLALCARLRAEGRSGDGALWAAAIARLGSGEIERSGEELLRSNDQTALLRAAREAAPAEAVERALEAHARLTG
jgi:hypothetical protein